MAVLTWSMFWIWLALVGVAGGAGTAWPLFVASARPGTVTATPTAADARARVVARAGRLMLGRCFTEILRVCGMSGVIRTRRGSPRQGTPKDVEAKLSAGRRPASPATLRSS